MISRDATLLNLSLGRTQTAAGICQEGQSCCSGICCLPCALLLTPGIPLAPQQDAVGGWAAPRGRRGRF